MNLSVPGLYTFKSRRAHSRVHTSAKAEQSSLITVKQILVERYPVLRVGPSESAKKIKSGFKSRVASPITNICGSEFQTGGVENRKVGLEKSIHS